MDFGLGLGLGIVIGLFMAGGLFVLLEMMERPRPTTSTQPSGPTTDGCTCGGKCWGPEAECQWPWQHHRPNCHLSKRAAWLMPELSGAWDTSTPEGRQS